MNASAASIPPGPTQVPPLHNGDRLTQREFHRRYETYPEDVRFELIGGTVYTSSPLSIPHSDYDEELGFVLGTFRRGTPGVQLLRNATTILGEESEPQPDLALRILPGWGGRSKDTRRRFVAGPPELVAEIAYSTRAIDLHGKLLDYRRAGVLEYLVLCIEEPELFWFSFRPRRALTPDAQGIYRSRAFPGLWIDGPALLRRDSDRLTDVLRQGLASREHAAFVEQLRTARGTRR